MKRKYVLRTFLGLIAIMIICFNLSIGESDNLIVNSYSIKNIRALQASASEAGCNPITQYYCRVTLPGGVILDGVGQPYYIP